MRPLDSQNPHPKHRRLSFLVHGRSANSSNVAAHNTGRVVWPERLEKTVVGHVARQVEYKEKEIAALEREGAPESVIIQKRSELDSLKTSGTMISDLKQEAKKSETQEQ